MYMNDFGEGLDKQRKVAYETLMNNEQEYL